MKAGDLVKIKWVYSGYHLNDKIVMYLGEYSIPVGVAGRSVKNIHVLPVGSSEVVILSSAMYKYLKAYSNGSSFV